MSNQRLLNGLDAGGAREVDKSELPGQRSASELGLGWAGSELVGSGQCWLSRVSTARGRVRSYGRLVSPPQGQMAAHPPACMFTACQLQAHCASANQLLVQWWRTLVQLIVHNAWWLNPVR
jgi:hypothetical protein